METGKNDPGTYAFYLKDTVSPDYDDILTSRNEKSYTMALKHRQGEAKSKTKK
jgi:hypothetical protein